MNSCKEEFDVHNKVFNVIGSVSLMPRTRQINALKTSCYVVNVRRGAKSVYQLAVAIFQGFEEYAFFATKYSSTKGHNSCMQQKQGCFQLDVLNWQIIMYEVFLKPELPCYCNQHTKFNSEEINLPLTLAFDT